MLSWFFSRNKNGGTPGAYGEGHRNLPPLGADGPLTLMAIMAHPDDIDFGSAGSIARWCAEGWTVYYVLATSGDKGTHDKDLSGQELSALREQEQRDAARVLGVKDVFFLGYPDGYVEPTAELRGEIVKLFRRYKPDVVLTWDGFRTSFNHIDHRNVGIAVRDAVYPATRDHLYYPEHAAEGLDEHRVNEMLLAGADEPDYFVDISAFLEKKVDAMLCHRSQVSTHDRDEMLKNLRERARQQGRKGMVESFKRVSIRRSQRTGQQPASNDQTAPAGAEASRT